MHTTQDLVLRGYGGFALHQTTPHRFQMRLDRIVVGDIGIAFLVHGPTLSYGVAGKYQNLGFATQAVRLVVAWGFDELRLEKIVARVRITNIASQKVLGRAGFNVEQIQRHIYLLERRNPKAAAA